MDLPGGYSVDTDKVQQGFFAWIISSITSSITGFFQDIKSFTDAIGLKGPNLDKLEQVSDPKQVKETLASNVTAATGITPLPDKPATPIMGGEPVDKHAPPAPTPAVPTAASTSLKK